MLRLERVSGGYSGGSVLSDLDLEVRDGEIVALIGPNGSGKTSTLRAISRTLPRTEGGIRFGEQDLIRLKGHQVVGLGIAHVPEGRRVFPRLSVRDNMALGGFVLNDRRRTERAIEQACETFPALKDRMNQLAGTLSGGEQQMLALARGLISAPKLMLLDEPSLGLSPRMTDEVFTIIEKLRAGGRAILLVEQNAMLALSIADRGYVLGNGRILAQGTSQTLLETEQLRDTYLGVGNRITST